MKNAERELLVRTLSRAVSKDAAELSADKLLERFGNIADISEAHIEDIKAVGDLSENAAILLALAAAATSRRGVDSFAIGKKHTEEEIVNYFKHLFIGVSEETVYMMSFDEKDRVVAVDFQTSGTINSSAFSVRRMIEMALSRKARKVIIAHNHPMGSAKPSRDDVVATETLRSAFASARVNLAAHYVVSGMNCARVELGGKGGTTDEDGEVALVAGVRGTDFD
ncbi:MAG: JAB domain-containing protein [Clostridia bacterium]|nr:JAB domain-containing protein [Clostridia bacterium]